MAITIKIQVKELVLVYIDSKIQKRGLKIMLQYYYLCTLIYVEIVSQM